MKTKGDRTQRVNVITLGCSKNLVDSENFITQMKAADWDVAHEPVRDAEVIVVNTCGFIDRAKEESVDTILHYAHEKQAGRIERLYVTGCLSERYKEDLIREIPEVDAFFGTMELPLLLNKFNVDFKQDLIGERLSMTPSHYAYLKISEGCNRTCSFCAIPLMRKEHRSRTIESLVEEARHLARRGVKELMLIAQESTYYGLDIYKRRALPDLLRALNDVPGIEWIRLHYAYPSKFPTEVLSAIYESDHVCNYIDLPLQHAADPVLKSMRRQIDRTSTQALVDLVRQEIPDVTLRTTMLVGFPGETNEDFQSLMEFVATNRFNRLGVFTYSHEEGTTAYSLEDDVPEDVKAERANQLMDLQRQISLELNQERIGRTMKTMIDRYEDGIYYGRSEGDSPEVDNEVIIETDQTLAVGSFYPVEIIDALDYDLIGKI